MEKVKTFNFNKIVLCLAIVTLLLCILVLPFFSSPVHLAFAEPYTSIDFDGYRIEDEHRTTLVGHVLETEQPFINLRGKIYSSFDFNERLSLLDLGLDWEDISILMLDLDYLIDCWSYININSYFLITYFYIYEGKNIRNLNFLFRKNSETELLLRLYVKAVNESGDTIVSNMIDYKYNIEIVSNFNSVLLRLPYHVVCDMPGLFDDPVLDTEISFDFKGITNHVSFTISGTGSEYIARSIGFSSQIFNDTSDPTLEYYYNYSINLVTSFYQFADTVCLLNFNKLDYWFDYGFERGYLAGYEEGYYTGITVGYNDGVRSGERSGYEKGYKEGEAYGYSVGYEQGSLYNSETGLTFRNLIFGLIDAPFKVFRESFNFEIFGVNISALILFVISGLLITWVIKKLI